MDRIGPAAMIDGWTPTPTWPAGSRTADRHRPPRSVVSCRSSGRLPCPGHSTSTTRPTRWPGETRTERPPPVGGADVVSVRQWSAPVVLVGEAPGKHGARWTGIPFTSPHLLTGSGRGSPPHVVHRVLAQLGRESEVLCWNASYCFHRATAIPGVRSWWRQPGAGRGVPGRRVLATYAAPHPGPPGGEASQPSEAAAPPWKDGG